MILQFLLIFADLLLHLVKRGIKNRADIVALCVGHEIMFMLSVNQYFDFGLRILEIDSDQYLRNPLEVSQQFFSFGFNMLAGFRTNSAMTTRDFYLHGFYSLRIQNGGSVWQQITEY